MNDTTNTTNTPQPLDADKGPRIIATAIASMLSLSSSADELLARLEVASRDIAGAEDPAIAQAELAQALRDVHRYLGHMVTTNRGLYDVVRDEDDGELSRLEADPDEHARRLEVSREIEAAVSRALVVARDHVEETGRLDVGVVMSALRDGAEPSEDGHVTVERAVEAIANAAAVNVGGDVVAILARTSVEAAERLRLVYDYCHDPNRLNRAIRLGVSAAMDRPT